MEVHKKYEALFGLGQSLTIDYNQYDTFVIVQTRLWYVGTCI